MKNCIFNAHCTEPICDKACPVLVESSYLLERNELALDNPVFNASPKDINKVLKIIHSKPNGLCTVISDNTIYMSNLLTYCAICENWQGNRLHCNVYHLKFSNYIDAIQHSWSVKDTPEHLEYEQIWINSAKVLIISNLDFVQFKDFQAQTLLNIIHNRANSQLLTIIVCPKLQSLVGSGLFYKRLQSMLEEVIVR